jgi:hypothetical protein
MKAKTYDKIIGLSLLLFFASPIVWIWFSWYYAWRIGLTGICLFFILVIIKTAIKQHLEEKEELKENDTNFQSKI